MKKITKNTKEGKALALTEEAYKIKIWNNDTAEQGGVLLNRVKAARAWWQGLCRPKIDKFKAQHSGALEIMRTLDDPLKDAEAYLKDGIRGVLLKVKREEDAAQAAAEAAARKEAEAERARQAKLLKKNGYGAQARQELRRPLTVAPVVASVEKPKLSNISLREVWTFRVSDASLIPREYMIPDEIKIGKIVRALKGECRIPGVEVSSRAGVAASS